MPRPNSIWWWGARDEWCVTINGIRHRLGENEAEAKLKFHSLMANPEKPICKDAVAAVIDEFLDWTQTNRKPTTYAWYQDHLQSFLPSLKPKTLVVGKLKLLQVHQWVDAMTCGSTVK